MTITRVLGLDLGANSVGVCLTEMTNDVPTAILEIASILHDGGQVNAGPGKKKSRRALAGEARRSRNRFRSRRARKAALKNVLDEHGYPSDPTIVARSPSYVQNHVGNFPVRDIYDVRAILASHPPLPNGTNKNAAVAAAVMHMASHRGQRNPWLSAASVKADARDGYSAVHASLRERCGTLCGKAFPSDLTGPQLLTGVRHATSRPESVRFKTLPMGQAAKLKRDEQAIENFLSGKAKRKPPAGVGIVAREELVKAVEKSRADNNEKALAQARKALDVFDNHVVRESLRRSDVIRELYTIADVQGLDTEFVEQIADIIIDQAPPGKAAHELVGFDELPLLPGQKKQRRAPTASLAFQEFRIIGAVGNLKHTSGPPLDPDERKKTFTLLNEWTGSVAPTWNDVADEIGVGRLRGHDNDAKPPFNTVNRAFRSLKGAGSPIKDFWVTASQDEREALLEVKSGARELDSSRASDKAVIALIDSLSEESLMVFEDGIKLENGRAAHSPDNLRALTEYMRSNAVDLHAARKAVFGVDDDWGPTPSPLGTLTGNPNVDVNINIVRRVWNQIVSKYGVPDRVVVESARDLASSPDSKNKHHTAIGNYTKKLNADIDEAVTSLGLTDFNRSDRRSRKRVMIYTHQNGQCLYCGTSVKFEAMEMDHIIPASCGGTDTRINRAGVCRGCNASKGNLSLAVWAKDSLKDIRARVNTMSVDAKFKKKYKAHLSKSECERPMESLSWAATELRKQLQGAAPDSEVMLVPGSVTAHARHIGKINSKRHPMLLSTGGVSMNGKSRLDRRHHAVDAAVLTLMRQTVVTVINEAAVLRDIAKTANREEITWDSEGTTVTLPWYVYAGKTVREQQGFSNFKSRCTVMRELLFARVLDPEGVPVVKLRRLKPTTAGIHNDTITPLLTIKLGEDIPAGTIRRASTPALWTALTRLPDFDRKTGLPADPSRTIRVKGDILKADDVVSFFTQNGGSLVINSGQALAQSVHHLRVNVANTQSMAVLQMDAARLIGVDVFGAELPPSSMSMRMASNPPTGGDWAVLMPGDELDIPWNSLSVSFKELVTEHVPPLKNMPLKMRVTGFDGTNIALSPLVLSDEGVEMPRQLRKSPFTLQGVTVVRRTVLGDKVTTGNRYLRSFVL